MLSVRILLVFTLTITLASCWGELGHRTVACLAQKQFTPSAQHWIDTTLWFDKPHKKDISDAALWADEPVVKCCTSGWHAVHGKYYPENGTCSVELSRDCHLRECKPGCGNNCDTKCILTAIRNQVQKVQEQTLDPDVRSEALKYILHFIGDLHQPLHTVEYEGGGHKLDVKFDTRSRNFHEIWDDDIALKSRNTSASADLKEAAWKWAEDLHLKAKLESCPGSVKIADNVTDCVMKWAIDTNRVNCESVFKPGIDYLKIHDLGDQYYMDNQEVVAEQIRKAGGRLAGLINALAEVKSEPTPALHIQDL